MTNLVRINTPKAVQTESRKAFRKLPNVEQAISTLTNLKGVGTTLASGLLLMVSLRTGCLLSWQNLQCDTFLIFPSFFNKNLVVMLA